MSENDNYDDYLEEDFNPGSQFKNEKEVNAPDYAAEGIYHFAVQQVDASGKNSPGAVFFTFEILTGNVDEQAGKTIRWPFWPIHPDAKNQETAARNRSKTVLRLMLAMGLRKEGEFPAVKLNRDWWEGLEGRQFMGRVTHQKKKETTEGGVEKTWINAVISKRDDFFAIGSADAAGVPISEEVARAAGYLSENDYPSIEETI